MPKTFLLVDDDLDDHDLFVEAVEALDASHRCISAFDGDEALYTLTKTTPPPDVIFLDLNMPGKDGMQTLAEIKNNESWTNIPVVVYTTASGVKERDAVLQLGAAHFLTKPSKFDDLKVALAEIVARHLAV